MFVIEEATVNNEIKFVLYMFAVLFGFIVLAIALDGYIHANRLDANTPCEDVPKTARYY